MEASGFSLFFSRISRTNVSARRTTCGRSTQFIVEQPVGEHRPTRGQGVLILKLAQMVQFMAETVGNERVRHRDFCNDDVKGE